MKTQAMSGRAHRSSSDAGSADGSSTSNRTPERSPTHSSKRRHAARSDGDHEYIRAEAIMATSFASQERLGLVPHACLLRAQKVIATMSVTGGILPREGDDVKESS
jgi:hypothetical protein